MPSATIAWNASIRFNGRVMTICEKDIVDIGGTKCMVIVPWRAPLISLLTGVPQTVISDTAKVRGMKVSIAGHERFKRLVKARNAAQSTSLLGNDMVSEEGVQRLFGDGAGAEADQPPVVFPRRKRKRDGETSDDPPPGMITATVDGVRIECVRPTMSRESLCVPLDETNISALLGYLHQGINSLEDIASAHEWAGRYPGRYKKKETGACMGQVDHGTPTKPCEGKDLGGLGDARCIGECN
ncbi:unnamed protein product [Prorocentrum cordatum]|uniref:Uncharacterized protein n=1 Tax=Prorocentrum cordatum TaxID=2364126 RepID=A0ABN9S011_9DINO|nr:unnamed protein product [Polarella glacialis]